MNGLPLSIRNLSPGDVAGSETTLWKYLTFEKFLDFLLSQSPAPRQALYRTGLDRLNAESARRFARPFAATDAQQADTVLQPLRRPWTYEDPGDPLEHFLREAKADIMEATRNSYEYIAAAGKVRRGASGIGEFWYPLY